MVNNIEIVETVQLELCILQICTVGRLLDDSEYEIFKHMIDWLDNF
jgi:hypothetical protein